MLYEVVFISVFCSSDFIWFSKTPMNVRETLVRMEEHASIRMGLTTAGAHSSGKEKTVK